MPQEFLRHFLWACPAEKAGRAIRCNLFITFAKAAGIKRISTLIPHVNNTILTYNQNRLNKINQTLNFKPQTFLG